MFIFLIALLAVAILWQRTRAQPRGRLPLAATGSHYRRLYSRRNFLKLSGAVAGAAVLAYSGADEAVDRLHRDHVQSQATNAAAQLLKRFGERWWFGYWATFAVIDSFWRSNPLSRWGRHCFETMVVGLPALWSTQRVLGASRPTEEREGARFHPFADDNAASGHAFIASIPWLVLARRAGAPSVRALAYFLSPWTGWSRLNDRKHYLSQILLGYGIAWEAVKSVESTAERSAVVESSIQQPPLDESRTEESRTDESPIHEPPIHESPFNESQE